MRPNTKFGSWLNSARQFTGDAAFGKVVTIIVHDTDRYGRTVGEVILPDGRNLNHELVKAGLAWWYMRYAPEDAELQRLEKEAREAKRGLWSDPRAVPPWVYRRKPKKTSTRNGLRRYLMARRGMRRSER